MIYKGVIIEESLGDKEVLKNIKIISTKVEKVTEKHATPWLLKWTLHTVEVSEDQAREIAEDLSHALEREHPWYADFQNETYHYIIFRDKVFFVDKKNRKEYEEVKKYGVSLGIPEYQVSF